MNQRHQDGLTYRDAGVDIDAGNRLVERIKPLVAETRRPELLGGIGGFEMGMYLIYQRDGKRIAGLRPIQRDPGGTVTDVVERRLQSRHAASSRSLK